MKIIKSLIIAAAMFSTMGITAALFSTMSFAASAMAQESSYKPGTVWEAGRIDVLPGQFENYMDYLATTWKKVQEVGKAEGMVLNYYVLQTNNARAGEPDLILITEHKDFYSTAQQEAMQKKGNALLAQDNRIAATASGERSKMRELLGSIEYQELILK